MNDRPCTVVCVFRSGNVLRLERRNHAAALEQLRECESTGIFVHGSIWTEDDVELESFGFMDSLDDR